MISQDKADFIRSLADADGHIEPSVVVAEARDPKCILHDEFQWGLQDAATAHWIDTAKRLIRFVKVEVTIEDRVFRSVRYVADPAREQKSKRFVDLTIAGRSRAMAREILQAEMERVISAIRRAREIALVLGLDRELDELLADVNRIRAKAKAPRKRAKKLRRKPKRSTSRRSAHGELRV